MTTNICKLIVPQNLDDGIRTKLCQSPGSDEKINPQQAFHLGEILRRIRQIDAVKEHGSVCDYNNLVADFFKGLRENDSFALSALEHQPALEIKDEVGWTALDEISHRASTGVILSLIDRLTKAQPDLWLVVKMFRGHYLVDADDKTIPFNIAMETLTERGVDVKRYRGFAERNKLMINTLRE